MAATKKERAPKAAYELEADAMKKIGKELNGLDVGARERVLAWVNSNFGSDAISRGDD